MWLDLQDESQFSERRTGRKAAGGTSGCGERAWHVRGIVWIMEFGGWGVQPREYKRTVQLPGSVAGEQESALQYPVMGHVILSKAKEGFKWRNPMIPFVF